MDIQLILMKQGLQLKNVHMDIHTETIWFIRNILLTSPNALIAHIKAQHGPGLPALGQNVMDTANLGIN